MRYLLSILMIALALALPVRAQEEAESGFLPAMVERQLSGEGRTVRLIGVNGLLSSNATVSEITVADDQGVWLSIKDAEIVWSRAALFTGRLSVQTLTASEISFLRRPAPRERELPSPEASEWQVPNLPLAIQIAELRVDRLFFDQSVFGLQSELTGSGALDLSGGNLNAALDLDRLDGAGGDARLRVSYTRQTDLFDISLDLQEPADGVIANALNLYERPPVSMQVQGSGKAQALDIDLTMQAGGQQAVIGTITTRREAGAMVIAADLTAQVQSLVTPQWRGIIETESSLSAAFRLGSDAVGVEDLSIALAGAAIKGDGVFAGGVFDGRLSFVLADLSPFAPLLGRDLAGSAALGAEGKVVLTNGGFDLAISGSTTDLSLGEARLDPLLAGTVDLSGRIQRDAGGITLDQVNLSGPRLAGRLDGTISSQSQQVDARLELADLGDLDLPVSGKSVVILQANGSAGVFETRASIQVSDGSALGQDVKGLGVTFSGKTGPNILDGTLDVLANTEIGLIASTAKIATDEQGLRLRNVELILENARATGEAAIDGQGQVSGVFAARIPDLGKLTGAPLSGRSELLVTIDPGNGTQDVAIEADFADLAWQGISAPSASARIDLTDLLGTLQARAVLTTAEITLLGQELTSSELRIETADLQTASVSLKANSAGGTALQGNATLSGLDTAPMLDISALTLLGTGLDARASGKVPLSGPGLSVDATMDRVDLSVLAAYLPIQGPTGTLSGSVTLRGDLARPQVDAVVKGQGLGTQALSAAGMKGFSADANLKLRDGTLQIMPLTVSSNSGLSGRVEGSLVLDSGAANLKATGNVPLAIADLILAERGSQIRGTAAVSVSVAGTLARPELSGTVTVSDASMADRASNLRLEQIRLQSSFAGDRLVISEMSGRSSAGGRFAISGSIGLSSWQVNPDLTLQLTNLAYADGKSVVTRLNGELTLRGPVNQGATLAGRIDLGPTTITIPDGAKSAQGGDLLEVRHRNIGAAAQLTLDRLAATQPAPRSASQVRPVRLDIAISAPRQIFVRGRGLNAEMQGSLTLGGTIGAIEPVGGFELRRGRIDILTRRMDITRGTVTLEGSLDPVLDFRAEAQSDGTTLIVELTGRASEPEVKFSASPALPEDEVIARLIFNNGVADMSAFQMVELASAINVLRGGDGGALGQIRNATGLDDFDVRSNDSGTTSVRAGKYLNERLYLDVETDVEGQTRATIELELTDSLTAKGTGWSDGNTGAGIFFEKDY